MRFTSDDFQDETGTYGLVSTTTRPSIHYVNESGLPDDVIERHFRRGEGYREIASVIEQWSQTLAAEYGGAGTQTLDVFNRNRGLDKALHTHAVMARCAWAVENDDVLSTLADVIEGLMWQKCRFELIDQDQQSLWNQWARDVNLDSFLRQCGREDFKVSQFYVGLWWGRKTYQVKEDELHDQIKELELEAKKNAYEDELEKRDAFIAANKGVEGYIEPPMPPEPRAVGPGKGNRKRKKKFPVRVPTQLTILDPTKVLPVGTLMFGRERFCYIATAQEDEVFGKVMNGDVVDETVLQLIERKYNPSSQDIAACSDLGVSQDRLWLFKKDAVFRHTVTRTGYERYAAVRLKPVLPILEMKGHLRASDRASLIGNALRVDQRIATPGGWVPIGQIHEGDLVMGRDGRPTRVAGVFPQGVRPLFRVGFSDGAEVVADENHRWAVHSKTDVSKGRPHQVLTTGEILASGLRDQGGRGVRWSVPLAEPVQFPEADLGVDPYLLGALLGDGGLTQTTPRITWAEADQPWRAHLPADITVTMYGSESNPSWGLRGTVWRQNSLTAALRKCGLMGGRGDSKFIPEEYLQSSVEQRWELLRGLFDTDGSPAQAGGVEYSTTSRNLAGGVVELAQSLGCVATLSTREGSETTREAYRVYVSLPGVEAPFKRASKVARWVPRKARVVRSITSIEPVLADEAVCIAVEADDQLFLTEGYVVTHNTNFIVVITKGTDKLPAKPAEIANLQEQARIIARLPVLIGDHRLHVEIVSPNTDNTLIDSRWQVLDSRLVFTALRTFSPVTQGGNASGAGVKEMSQVVAKGLESKRHMIMRSLEEYIFQVIMDKNEGVIDETPHLEFAPKRITLDFSVDIVNAILKLRDRGDISRETTLEELDYDQDVEVLRRAREKAEYDDTFQSGTPFASPATQPYSAPGQAVPGLTPPQLPPGGNQNVVNRPPKAANVGPAGQPRTEGGRPPGTTETKSRATKKATGR